MASDIRNYTMLILNKDDLEFLTEFPCLQDNNNNNLYSKGGDFLRLDGEFIFQALEKGDVKQD